MQLPPPLEPPIQALGKPIEALLCEEEERGFITINDSVLRKHSNKEDNWSWAKEEPEHWTRVKVQTFFTGRFRRYFVMHVPEDRSVNPCLTKEDEAEAAVIKRQWKEVKGEA